MTKFGIPLIGRVIAHELRTLAREKIFALLMAIFFAMTLFSVYIGWSTRVTTTAIYDVTAAALRSAGTPHIPPDPILGVTPLMVFNNLVVYILLVGALFSVVIGHRSFIRERKSGVLPLVFVRQSTKIRYAIGKLLGIESALAAVVASAFLMSLASALIIPTLSLSGAELLRLAGLYVSAFLYLSFFAMLGFLFAAYMETESGALFAPIMCWIAAVFVLPELSTGQNPVALLNPITLAQAPPSASAFFTFMHPLIAPFSVGRIFTENAFRFLEGSGDVVGGLIKLFAYAVAAAAMGVYAVRSYAVTSDMLA